MCCSTSSTMSYQTSCNGAVNIIALSSPRQSYCMRASKLYKTLRLNRSWHLTSTRLQEVLVSTHAKLDMQHHCIEIQAQYCSTFCITLTPVTHDILSTILHILTCMQQPCTRLKCHVNSINITQQADYVQQQFCSLQCTHGNS